VGKNKLAKWNEFGSFEKVIQPEIGDVADKDHPIKGKWKSDLFRNENPLILDLGCGKGEYSVGLASRYPGNNYIGIDIKGARMWRGAKTASEKNLPNVAFLRTRIEFVNSFFSEDEIDEIWITFPDPHPGGRNAGKRLTSPVFLNNYRRFLKNNGLVHLKTDNTELFKYTQSLVMHNMLETLINTENLYSGNFPDEILAIKTHYETLFLKKGLNINYLSFRMQKNKIVEDVFQKTKRG